MDRETMHRRYDMWDQYFSGIVPNWDLWTLEGEINDAINNSYSTENLSYDDIGKVLVKIAAAYFEE